MLCKNTKKNRIRAYYPKKEENPSILFLALFFRGYNVFGFMRLQRLFRNIRFRIGSTLLSHFVAMGG